jgi:hypothetical protein
MSVNHDSTRYSSAIAFGVAVPPPSDNPEVFDWYTSVHLIRYRDSERNARFNLGLMRILFILLTSGCMNAKVTKYNRCNHQKKVKGERLTASHVIIPPHLPPALIAVASLSFESFGHIDRLARQ